jgi:hypothetical protein
VAQGFTQCIAERKVYYKRGGSEVIIIVVYVDENLMFHTVGPLWESFLAAWHQAFQEHENAAATSNEFCDLVLTDLPTGGVGISTPKVLGHLNDLLLTVPWPDNLTYSTPLASDNLLRIKMEPTLTNPKMDEDTILIARRIVGTAGFVCNSVRLDALLAYVTVSQYLGSKMSRGTFRAILRLCKYLVSTKGIMLCFHPGPRDEDFKAAADSSCLNGPEPGSQYGGYHMFFPGSGSFLARCQVPRKLTDSSGGGELTQACLVVKGVIWIRMLLRELGVGQANATQTGFDTNNVIQGAEMERLSRSPRWLAAKLATVRQTVRDGVVILVKVPFEANRVRDSLGKNV